MKRIRRRLRWFTFIVVVLAGVNSYFSGSLAESGGVNVTGLGGAFATAFFVLLWILIFISIPFNVLAFFVARINRYPLQASKKINQVLTWLTIVFSLFFGIYCYFGGIIAGSLTVTGVGGAIYAIIIVMLVTITVVAIPVNVLAFIFFAIWGPRKSDALPGATPASREKPERVKDYRQRGWTIEHERAFQQQSNSPTTLPDMKALFEAQDQNDWKKAMSQFAHRLDQATLGGSIALALMRDFGFSKKEAQEEALKWSEVLGEVSSQSAKFAGEWDHLVLHKTSKQTPEEILKSGGIKIVRQLLKEYQKELHAQQVTNR
ncbi:MAG TPA: hypothetical protein VFV38_26520 [Ktedonobacteraceae bacterium]|nr:hypothetical protein [Ktedonobacteraceae bacterium]